MAIPGNTTMYLLAGTGLDYDNTIWMHRFAYHYGDPNYNIYNELNLHLFNWLKAHSISQGYWYMNRVSPSKGYFDVGRQSLVKDYLSAFSQEGLGEPYLEEFLQDPMHNYELGIPMIDYVVWSDDDGNIDYTCAFVDRIVGINLSTVRIYFTIDAFLSYQKYFIIGPSWVEREHVYQEWDENNRPVLETIGTEPEPFAPDEDDMIFESVSSNNGLTYQLEDLGSYDQTFVTTDIKLDSLEYIQPRDEYPAFPKFWPAPRVKVTLSHAALGVPDEFVEWLSIGLYRVDNWENEVFTELGKYDAFEHILYTYTVPHKLIEEHEAQTNPVQVEPKIDDTLKGSTTETDGCYPLEIPYRISDTISQVADGETSEDLLTYRPLNAKSYYAPYMYISVTDCQGASKEYQPQLLVPREPTHGGIMRFEFKCRFTELPNVPSSLWVSNYKKVAGGQFDPLYTLWQMPAYSMTPNASGWGTQIRDACWQKGLMVDRVKVATPFLLAGGLMDAASAVQAQGLQALGAAAGDLGAVLGSAAGGATKAVGSAISNIPSSFGGGVLGGAVTASNAAAQNEAQGEMNAQFGLPKAIGGLPNGTSILALDHVGYKFFFAHVNNNYLRKVDAYFSMYGYAVNTWKYPNINTRRRWNYVKTKVPILEPATDSWSGTIGTFIPMWAQEQVKQRLNNGITFWNLRWALFEDDSDTTNDHGAPLEYDAIPRKLLFCSFVKNYGLRPDSPEMKENQSIKGGYAEGVYDPLKPDTWTRG